MKLGARIEADILASCQKLDRHQGIAARNVLMPLAGGAAIGRPALGGRCLSKQAGGSEGKAKIAHHYAHL